MTVEAAFIVPIFIALLAMIVTLSFAEYDRTAVLQECSVRAVRESVRRGSSAPAALPENGWVSYIGLENLEITTKAGSRAEVSAEGTVQTPIPFDAWMESGNPFAFSVTVRARRTDPPQSFRRYRRSAAVLRTAAETFKEKD